MNPLKRKKPITRQIGFLKKEMPNCTSIDVGYFVGCQSAKVWLVSNEELEQMYKKYKVGSEIALWCDMEQAADEPVEDKRKRKHPEFHPLKRQDREVEVDTIFGELRDRHNYTYETPQLRLWARMIQCGTHDDYEDPPRVP